jgi:hypothetical protein
MTTETKPAPWELARTKGKIVICKVFGPTVGVYYPNRKGGDLYVISADNTFARCCQPGCEADVPIEDFLEHVNSHWTGSKKKMPDFIIDQALVKHDGVRKELKNGQQISLGQASPPDGKAESKPSAEPENSHRR